MKILNRYDTPLILFKIANIHTMLDISFHLPKLFLSKLNVRTFPIGVNQKGGQF